VSPAAEQIEAPPATGGKALAGFLLSGFLLALLGAMLPAWGYHRDPADFVAVGNFFLSLAVGIVVSVGLARPIIIRKGLTFLLVFACALCCADLAYLAVVSNLLSSWWRVGGLFVLGLGAGLLNMALFYAIAGSYRARPARTATYGGIWYGTGCLLAAMLVGGMLYAYDVSTILIVMAVVPGLFAWLYYKSDYKAPKPGTLPTLRQAFRDFRTIGAILFVLVLFFQFGNEWTIAGWLPLFLYRRVGLSPKVALFDLVLYWFSLMVGRFGAAAILPRVRHGWLLLGSVASALFGCLILYLTDNKSISPTFNAATGAIFIGAGYASICPMVAEAIGRRFPYYHPRFFNGIFSFALVGGLLAPATLGYAAWALDDVRVVVGIPLLGTCVVMILVPLIWLETKVTGR
jgi:fucose permease